MKKIYLLALLMMGATATVRAQQSFPRIQNDPNLRGVILQMGGSTGYINWVRSDTSLYIVETILFGNSQKTTNYWWALKKGGRWETNLPSDHIDAYIGSLEEGEISWFNLPGAQGIASKAKYVDSIIELEPYMSIKIQRREQ